MTVVNDQLTHQVTPNEVSDRPIIDASYDVHVLDDVAEQAVSSVDSSPVEDVVSPDSLMAIWSQLNELLSNGQLYKDHPALIALIEQLKQSGVLPTSGGEFNAASLTTFHQWFKGMPSTQFSDLAHYFRR